MYTIAGSIIIIEYTRGENKNKIKAVIIIIIIPTNNNNNNHY